MLLHISKARKSTKVISGGGGGGTFDHPNQPVGSTVLIDQLWPASLASIPEYPSLTADPLGVGFEGGAANCSIITPTTNPYSSISTRALRMLFNHSDPNLGGTAPATLTNDYGERSGGPPPMDELYCEFFVRLGKPSGVGNDLTSGWDDGFPVPNAGTKLTFFLISETTSSPNYSNVFLSGTTPGAGAQIEAENAGVGVQNPGAYGFSNNKDWFPVAHISDGSWQRFECHAKSNTGSSYNGIFEMWRNGIKILNLTDVKFFPDGVPKNWIKYQISPTFGGGTNEPLTDQFMDWGPHYLSGKDNGF